VAFIESIPFSETRGYVKTFCPMTPTIAILWARKTLLSDAEWKLRY
jgi:hypothetical protein